jgi:hypothetical protein
MLLKKSKWQKFESIFCCLNGAYPLFHMAGPVEAFQSTQNRFWTFCFPSKQVEVRFTLVDEAKK